MWLGGGNSEPSVSAATFRAGVKAWACSARGPILAKTDNTRSPTASLSLCTSIQSVRVAGRVSLPMGKFSVGWGGAEASSPARSALRTGRGRGGRASLMTAPGRW